MPQIHIKQKQIGKHHIRDQCIILSGSTKIGEITFKKQNKIFIIRFISIYQNIKTSIMDVKSLNIYSLTIKSIA